MSNNSVEVAAGVGLYMYASGTTTCHLAVVVGNSASNTGTGANGIEVLTAGSGVINNLSYSSNSTYNFTVPQIVSNTGSGITGACYFSGSGSPNSVLTAPLGSIYTNQSGGSGTTLYVKESGAGTTNTGWVGK